MSVTAEHSSEGKGINGFLLVMLLVVVGVGVTGVFFRWQAVRLHTAAVEARDSLPVTPEGKIDRWLPYGRTYIDQWLRQLRFSSEQPWIVTHTFGAVRNGPEQEIWGLDLSQLTLDATQREGLDVVVSLPAARLVGHGPIEGDRALNVPHFAPGQVVADPNLRAKAIAESSLFDKLARALEKDIQGAHLVVRVGEDAPGERGDSR